MEEPAPSEDSNMAEPENVSEKENTQGHMTDNTSKSDGVPSVMDGKEGVNVISSAQEDIDKSTTADSTVKNVEVKVDQDQEIRLVRQF